MGLNVEQLSPIVLFLSMVALTWVKNNRGQLFYIQAHPSAPVNGYVEAFKLRKGGVQREVSDFLVANFTLLFRHSIVPV